MKKIYGIWYDNGWSYEDNSSGLMTEFYSSAEQAELKCIEFRKQLEFEIHSEEGSWHEQATWEVKEVTLYD